MASASPPCMAAVLYGINDLRVEAWPMPAEVPPGKVRVAIQRLGICGSDVHFLEHGRIGPYVVNAPMVIGHECAGVVVAIGPPSLTGSTTTPSATAGNQPLAIGDAVALEPGAPCWHCSAARVGRYNLDPDIRFFATPPVHGALATYVDHPAELCYKLPAGVSLEEGAMCEPLSVGVHACRRGGVQPGKSVAILGAGPIGIICAKVAAAFGADDITITDVKQDRLDFAAAHCPRATTRLVGRQQAPEDAAAALLSADGDSSSARQPPAVVIDCCGSQQTLETAVHVVERGGCIVLVGMAAETVALPSLLVCVKEIDLLGSFRYCNTYSLCISLLASKRVEVLPLITHRLGFTAASVAEGFEAATRPDAIKVMFSLPEVAARAPQPAT